MPMDDDTRGTNEGVAQNLSGGNAFRREGLADSLAPGAVAAIRRMSRYGDMPAADT